MGCPFLVRAGIFVRRLGRFVLAVRQVGYRTASLVLVGQGRGSGPYFSRSLHCLRLFAHLWPGDYCFPVGPAPSFALGNRSPWRPLPRRASLSESESSL